MTSIYTFYSYKGGVGRTMALANIAELFYQAGLTVLMIDWDLEAPGLERFFPTLQENILEKRGIIDMLLKYKREMSQELPDSVGNPISLLESPMNLRVDVYPDNPSLGKLWFIPSGRRSGKDFTTYANAVLTFDWQDFYENWAGEQYFDWLRKEFKKIADVVLIDSRTGVTEMGGVCTYQLADAVVMFCATNQQNLDGIYRMARSFKRPELESLRPDRPLEVVIVPARIENAEGRSLNQFKRDFIKKFENLVPEALGDSPERLWELGIPYVPYYAYNERVAVRERGEAIAEAIVESFEKLASALTAHRALILTSLEVEYMAVRAHLTDLKEETHPSGTVYERGSFIDKNQKWDVCIIEIGAGNLPAALETERAINYFNPSVVLFVGVARGIKDVGLGDVVVATKIYGYESGKVEENFKVRPEVGNCSYALVQRARTERSKQNWLQRLGKNERITSPRVFVGPIAAGEKVVAEKLSSLSEFLRLNYNDALAVEIEGYGFLKAALANQHVKALIVRGISDLIEDKSEADGAGWQEIASHHASVFAFEVLAKYQATVPSSVEKESGMSQYDKLRIRLEKLVDTEFRDLIRVFLTLKEQNSLPLPVKSVNQRDFLSFMQSKERLDEVEEYLSKHNFQKSKQDQRQQSIQSVQTKPPRLPFVNRQEELNRILSPLAPPYHLIDAPAGYGKTALLQELKYQFESQNWLCAYVSVQKDRTIRSITHTLAAKLQVSLTQDDDTRNLGPNLAEAIVQQRGHEFSSQEKGKKGVVLLIDIDGRQWDSMSSIIKTLFTHFIPNIEQELHSFEFFQKGHNRFRVIFAGRYQAGKTPRQAPFRLSLLKPAAFTYEVVGDMVKAYLPQQGEIRQLTAHLMHITAGHPGVIARVLKLYQERGQDSPNEFFRYYADEIWEDIVWPESDMIRKDIDSELRRIFDDLTVFRYLNESVLQELLDEMRLPQYPDAFDLADVLTGAYLMDWEGRLLRDSLTRGLLVRRFLQEIGTEAFAERCLRAQKICEAYLQEPSAQMPEKWMIEFWFQYLQQHTSDIESAQKRVEIRQNFLVNVVPYALQLLVNQRMPRQQQAYLKRVLEEDWEFRFTVNYYLREDQYNDDPYSQLQEKIDDFFTQIQEAGGKSV